MLKTYYLICYIKKKKAWSLGQQRQAMGYGAIDQSATLFHLELRRKTPRKRLFCEIHSPTDYSVLNFRD
jgi:hypothetical protein